MSLDQLIKDYFKIEYNRELLSLENSFVFYSYHVDEAKGIKECLIHDFYSNSKDLFEGKRLLEKLKKQAIEDGLEYLSCFVTTGIQRLERSSRLIRTYITLGFKVLNATNGQVVLIYKLKE